MIFTSWEFFFFLIVVFIAYWKCCKSTLSRNVLILVSSYFFYGYWDVRFLFLITISTCVDFVCAQAIANKRVCNSSLIKAAIYLVISSFLFLVVPALLFNTGLQFPIIIFLVTISFALMAIFLLPRLMALESWNRAKVFLTLSILTNLSILAFFKYFNFFADSFIVLSQSLFNITPNSFTLDIILPVGISFYTFQTISYSIDVYRKSIRPSESIFEFAAFVSFFPQLVAGPIERGKNLLPQFQTVHAFPCNQQLKEAVWLIVWGVFKKLVIADNAALIVNQVFMPFDSGTPNLGATEGLTLMIAVVAFAIQIYCDFSGYSDIARGTAKLFGFELMVNFNLPYFASDPSSFWRRWHISLSTWLRDYLYIPLGGNKGGSFSVYRNLIITMLLGGLWHGASWNFILWGAYHGALLSIYRALNIDTEAPGYHKFKKFLMAILFFQFTCIGWLIFRAQDIPTINHFLYYIFTNPVGNSHTLSLFVDLLYYCWFLFVFQALQFFYRDLYPMAKMHWFVQLNIWYFIIMSVLTLSAKSTSEFIYFAF